MCRLNFMVSSFFLKGNDTVLGRGGRGGGGERSRGRGRGRGGRGGRLVLPCLE